MSDRSYPISRLQFTRIPDMSQTPISQDASVHLRYVTGTGSSSNAATNSYHQQLEDQLNSSPLFSASAITRLKDEQQKHFQGPGKPFSKKQRRGPQHGLLGLHIDDESQLPEHLRLMYANVSSPWSAFICGSQGSGKSHTLSCILENALIPTSPVGKVSSPLAGMVVHYDKFTSFSGTQLCEAAYLCSSKIPVRVLVSPTNYASMKKAYESLPELKGPASKYLEVVPMYLSQKHLTITMMKTLMGIGSGKDQPLYIEV